jgi:hypothetical protein
MVKYSQSIDQANPMRLNADYISAQDNALHIACATAFVNCSYYSGQPNLMGARTYTWCDDQDVAAGTIKWHYYAVPSTTCAYRIQHEKQSGVNPATNISCCSTSHCNKPDPTVDNFTLAVQQPELLPANLTCHMDLVPAYGSSGLQAPHGVVSMMFPASIWNPGGPYERYYQTQTLEMAACARYKYVPCPQVGVNAVGLEDATCTPERAGVPAWAHRYIRMYDCMLMQEDISPRAGPLEHVSNVTCCNTDGCNAPLPEAAAQQVIAAPLAQVASGSIQCYENMQLGELISTDVARAVRPRDFNISRGWVPPYNAQDHHFAGTGFSDVCYSARVDLCATGGKSCSAAEAAAGVWEWQYSLESLSRCWQQQWEVANGVLLSHQHVTCCASDLCNKPDPALDPATQVRSALHPAGALHLQVHCILQKQTLLDKRAGKIMLLA